MRWMWVAALIAGCGADEPSTMAGRALPPPTPGPDARVYGYLAYWDADLTTVPWDEITDIALFAADIGADGSLSNTSRWGDLAAVKAVAALYGVRVDLCVVPVDSPARDTMLGSAAARARLIDQLANQVTSLGVDGANVDIEGIAVGMRDEMVSLVDGLHARVPEVVVATPAVDWGAWDLGALAQDADLFIMGYDYHWRTSTDAGPVDPLFASAPWNEWSLEWTVDDYLSKGATRDKLILGLPLYGYRWPTSSDALGARTTGSGTSVFYADAQAIFAAEGRRFEPNSRSPWAWDGSGQVWAPDAGSVAERVAWGVGEGLGGVGFWALNYDGGDVELWEGVRAVTTGDGVVVPPDDTDTQVPADTDQADTDQADTDLLTDTGDGPTTEADTPLARVGPPFLAYVGEQVVLNGSSSESRGNGKLSYRWEQVAGMPVKLDDEAAINPTFIVKYPGTLAFDLVVKGGDARSEAARAYVVVTDKKIGRRYDGACDVGGGLGGVGLLAGALAMLRRR